LTKPKKIELKDYSISYKWKDRFLAIVVYQLKPVDVQGGAKNGANGNPISLQIFRKLHDRIAWKLVYFCNIIAEQSLTFCLKISLRCGAT